MSTKLFPFPAQIPFTDPVTGKLTREAIRALDAFFLRMGGVYAPSNTELDEYLQFDIREADTSELAKRVRDIEAVEPATHIAQIAELTKRVAELEDEVSAIANLTAQVAELSKALRDSQTESMFT